MSVHTGCICYDVQGAWVSGIGLERRKKYFLVWTLRLLNKNIVFSGITPDPIAERRLLRLDIGFTASMRPFIKCCSVETALSAGRIGKEYSIHKIHAKYAIL